MNFRELIVLLPCHSLEDLPLYYEGDEADGLLAAWTSLWHPHLIGSAHAAPGWQRADAPPTELSGRLFVVPRVAEERLPAGFADRVARDGGLLVPGGKRDEILTAALGPLDRPAAVDAELTADFLALGYGRLQVELLTRQMRYASNLDETAFAGHLVAAAEAALLGDLELARSELGQCFHLLGEARKYFYPVDSYLVDLTLVAETTLGDALCNELSQPVPLNVLLPAALLGQIAQSHPRSWAALRAALERNGVSLVGGELEELEPPLAPLENMLANLRAGGDEFERRLGRRPRVFGRRRYGLTPTLPQLLHKSGYHGALHFTLDDGRFPLGLQSKVRWEGDDGSPIDALARVPRDAARPEAFLDFARRMGEAMDADHVATLSFAHWPGMASPWYDDLRRVCRHTAALGKFVTLDEYFEQTYAPSHTARFMADEYRSPYLKQAIVRNLADPLSSVVAAHRRRAVEAACEAVSTLSALLSRGPSPADDCARPPQPAPAREPRLELARAVERFAAVLPRADVTPIEAALVINPLSFARQVLVERATTAVPTESTAAGTLLPPEQLLVDVPAMGFAQVDVSAAAPQAGKRAKPIAADNVLANEFFEVTIHPAGGGIQIIRDLRQRGNRLSQQLALRRPAALTPMPGEIWRDPDESASYSAMQAESIEVTRSGSAVGEITSRGSLVDAEGQRLAGFVQRTQVWRGSRLIRLDLELDPAEALRADPWNSYYAARFAWSDATVELFRGVQGGRQPTEAKRLEAPDYLEIDAARGRTTILTGGLAYHRRSAQRVVDSLLLVRGESARRFQLAIGIDVPNPAAAALDWITPPLVQPGSTRPLAGNRAGWLMHLDTRSVVATHWAPLGSGDDSAPGAGGFRVRLLETTGRPVRAGLKAFRNLTQARKVDFLGQLLAELPVSGDRLECDLTGHEWAELEVRF